MKLGPSFQLIPKILKVILNAQPLRTLNKIAKFVESKNTHGSGHRYIIRFINAIEEIAQPNLQYALCNNIELARLNFNCRSYNDWIIVFKIQKDVLKVYRILHSSTIP